MGVFQLNIGFIGLRQYSPHLALQRALHPARLLPDWVFNVERKRDCALAQRKTSFYCGGDEETGAADVVCRRHTPMMTTPG